MVHVSSCLSSIVKNILHVFCVMFGDDSIKNYFVANSSVGVFTYLELIQVIVDFIYYTPVSAISYSIAYMVTEPKGRCLL